MVWQIRQSVMDPYPEHFFSVFSLQDKVVVDSLVKPQKETLLHKLIQFECEVIFTHIYETEGLSKLQEYLNSYIKPEADAEEVSRILNKWGEEDWYTRKNNLSPNVYYENLITNLLPLTPLTDLMFFTLFTDRLFLYHLNIVLSKMCRFLQNEGYQDFLSKKGKIKRLSYIPKWLEKGIFKRDQGHCVQCGKDLTGIRTVQEMHLDHIIPLARYGCNDPVNFQLFCKACNLKKGKKDWPPPEENLSFW